MATKDAFLELTDLSGGRNPNDSPLTLPDNQVVEAQNVEWHRAGVARRRQGTQTNTTGSFSNVPCSLLRHIPADNEAAQELWALDVGGPVWRAVAGGSAWVLRGSITDGLGGSGFHQVDSVSFNNKLYLAYPSGADRLHVFSSGSGFLRRAGLPKAAVPTVANNGAGAYAAKLRFYKIQWYGSEIAGKDLFSELSDAVSFTPSGAGASARITRPALPPAADLVTSWWIWGSRDGIAYYLVAASINPATTFFDDTVDPDTYSSAFALTSAASISPNIGDHLPATSVRYLLVDENRLIMAGSFTTADHASRVWWTPVLGTTTSGTDDERIPTRNRLDIDVGNGGSITGLATLMGSPYVFKSDAIYKLSRTGDVTNAYIPIKITGKTGAISRRSIVEGYDENGSPCLYFLGRTGPFRLGLNGLQYLGEDILDIWKRLNHAFDAPPFGMFHAEKQQVMWFIQVDGATNPNLGITFNVKASLRADGETVRGGWSQRTLTGPAISGVMFSRTPGATMSLDLKPYVSFNQVSVLPRQFDADGVNTDNGTGYRGYIKTKIYKLGTLGRYQSATDAFVMAQAQSSSAPLRVTLNRDTGKELRHCDVTILALGSGEERPIIQVEDASLAQIQALQLEVGDADATATLPWALDAVTVKLSPEDER